MASRPASPLLAFGAAIVGIAIFSSMDAVMKVLVLQIGAFTTLFWRTLAGIVFTGAVYFPTRKSWPGAAAMRVHLIRGGVSSVMAVTFFWGLAKVPMAQALALAFIAPLLALFGAAFLLKEKIPPRAIVASLIAFGGVGVILLGQAAAEQSHDVFVGTIAILISAVCYAYNIILMRQQSLLAGPSEVAFFQSLIVGAIFACFAPFFATLPPVQHVPLILLAAALAVVSLMILAWAYARGEANYLAPTEYTGFVWASLWGWVVFREPIANYTLIGAALIITGCLIAARKRPKEIVVANVEAAI